MNRLVSMKHSALIHFIPCELASDPHLATQRANDLVIALQAVLVARVIGEPMAELLVQGGVLGSRALAGSLDQLFIGTQRNVLHGINLSIDCEHEYSVHDIRAQRAQATLSASKPAIILLNAVSTFARSEESRVGKECRSR